MLIHKGNVLEKTLRKIVGNVSTIAIKTKYSRRQVYNHFDTEELPDEIIRIYAQAFNYNFKEEFPDLYTKWVLQEPNPEYMLDKSKEILQAEVEKYRSLYIKSLEEKQELLKEMSALKDRLK